MKRHKTLQEEFWAGDFGDAYVERNRGEQLLASNIALFGKILARTENVRSVIEFGANIGLNLRAVRQLRPEIELSAIEINQKAIYELEGIQGIKIYPMSILDFVPDVRRDFVFTKGVLIHIHPEQLPGVYESLYQTSQKYICLAEYYNPTPVTIEYREHKDRLFKRDFAGEMLESFGNLRLVDYGFAYRRDVNFPQDDISWFLMQKMS